MRDSPASSDLSDPPSGESDGEDQLSSSGGGRTSRRSLDHSNADPEQLAPPSKRRKTALSALVNFDRASSSHLDEDDDNISVSSDGFSSAPGSPNDDEYSLRDQAQTQCLWRDCDFGTATNNDELVKHVQSTHCATGGPKKTKYVCEWGECQRKTSNHPSGYALKAHMRSHTKEKPYYCALPECDKAFTRSDALAKHMRTVHEPEPARGSGMAADALPVGKKGGKLKLANGNAAASSPKSGTPLLPAVVPPPNPHELGPTHDEDGNEVEPSPPNDNIAYIPAHHPITGQPGFMIHYPPDIRFSTWESEIAADQLMRLLRRQVHWAEQEREELRRELAALERQKRDEWMLKEILLDGVLEAQLAHADAVGLLRGVDARVRDAMQRDAAPAARLPWAGGDVTNGTPAFRRAAWRQKHGMQEARQQEQKKAQQRRTRRRGPGGKKEENDGDEVEEDEDEDDDNDAVEDDDEDDEDNNGVGGDDDEDDDDVSMRDAHRPSISPPPGGFDGDDDPYDNYLKGRLAEYEERERMRSMQNTPAKGAVAANPDQQAAEADAVGALLGMSGGKA